jgi:tetraacyldisaccharide 4'-kinase
MSLADRLVAGWYAPRLTPLCAALLPLSLLFRVAVSLRRAAYRARLLPGFSPPVPTAVVGNIVVGGAGKTPLTRALAEVLAARGWRPGIVSRRAARGFDGRRCRRGRRRAVAACHERLSRVDRS